MSGRMVKRLLKSQEKLVDLQATSAEVDEDETSELEEDGDMSSPAVNPFDLLNEEEVGEEDEEEDKEEHVPAVAQAPTKVDKPLKPGKKKKGKSKGKSKSLAHGAPQPASTRSDDELLDLLAQVKSADVADGRASEGDKVEGQAATSSFRTGTRVPSVLGVDSRHLKAEDELRRIFGAKVINQVERDRDDEGAAAAGFAGLRRRLGGGARRGGPRTAGALRKCQLTTPLEHWPRVEEGLSMECLGTAEGVTRFRYVHSEAYAAVQRKYESCVQSHDPNTIAELLAHHPYHVDSLLTLSDFYRHMGEHQTAADLIDRCLYALECAWHPWFNPEHGTCRLDYSWEPNRSFFRVLFRHMQHLGRRGCHRTALEICKLILSLDPDDPLGVTFCIDYFALRSEQYAFLNAFVDAQSDGGHSLAVFPNFAFSLALAAFRREQRRRECGRKASSSREEPVVEEEGGGSVPSSELLEQALMLHPVVLSKIVDKAPVKVDSEWQKILKHKVFASANAGGPSLEHLVEIYIERQHLLWRGPDVQAWLKAAAKAVIASYDSTKGKAMADWACVRSQAFPSTSNEYRHLHVSEFSNNIAALPPEEFAGGQPQPAEHAPNLADYALRNHNTLMALLESMLPWVDLGVDLRGQDAPNAPGEQQGDGHGHGRDNDNNE